MNTHKLSENTCKMILCASCAVLWLFSSAANAKYSGGSGTAFEPYRIGEVNDLLLLGEETGDYDKHFILTADLDLDPNLPGNRVFDKAVIAPGPHGQYSLKFTGHLDGSGHKIRNLTINGDSFLGLFGYLEGGEIKNLGLENVYIIGASEIGGMIGASINATIRKCYSKGVIQGGINCRSVGGLIGGNAGNIINCYSEGVVISAGSYQYPGSAWIGGLVGANIGDFDSTPYIADSWSSCDVIGGNGSGYLGGLTGAHYAYEYAYYSCFIINCYSTGTVRGYSSSLIGGLIGYNHGSITKCFSTSPVIGEGTTYGIGGLTGWNEFQIYSSLSTGSVTAGNGSSIIGGLIGYSGYSDGMVNIYNSYSTGDVNSGNLSSNLGGLIGNIYNGHYTNSYSSGDVNGGSGSYSIGGMVGSSDYPDINHCFFLETSGPDNGLGTPLTDANMKKRASFTGWEFVLDTIDGNQPYNAWTDVWSIKEDANYPVLVWPLVNLKSSKFPFGWYEVDFCDFAMMAQWWGREDCADNNNCDNADFDFSGKIDLYDLKILSKYWLDGTVD